MSEALPKSHAPWRMYGRPVMGLAVTDDGEPAEGWIHVLMGDCENPEVVPDFDCPIPGLDQLVNMPLLETWDHEPSRAEIDAATPEEYREPEGAPEELVVRRG